MRCGRGVEAWVEMERKVVIAKVREPGFRLKFISVCDVLELDGPNPFKDREVHGNTEVGMEIAYPAAFVPQVAFEKQPSVQYNLEDVKTIKQVSMPVGIGGLPMTGVVCDLAGLPPGLKFYGTKLFYKKSANLTECYMTGKDQARDEQGMKTLQWLAAQNDKDGPAQLATEQVVQHLPTWDTLVQIVADAKQKALKREAEVRAAMAEFGCAPPSSGNEDPNAGVILSSGSRFNTFVQSAHSTHGTAQLVGDSDDGDAVRGSSGKKNEHSARRGRERAERDEEDAVGARVLPLLVLLVSLQAGRAVAARMPSA